MGYESWLHITNVELPLCALRAQALPAVPTPSALKGTNARRQKATPRGYGGLMPPTFGGGGALSTPAPAGDGVCRQVCRQTPSPAGASVPSAPPPPPVASATRPHPLSVAKSCALMGAGSARTAHPLRPKGHIC